MPGWNWQKIRQKLSSTLRLNFRYLKIVCYLHLRYHPEIIDDILKTIQKTTATVLMINDNENEADMKNGSQRYDTKRTRPRHENKYIKYTFVSI